MSRNHLRFLARTVLVENGQVDAAFQSLERIMTNDKLTQEIKRQRYREKPFEERNRLAFEKCKRIYNYEMKKKIDFLMRKNRTDPYPN